MKAIIMAAGKGTRISRHINGKPKCTVFIEKDITLIEYTVNLLKSKGIDNIIVITGYKSFEIKKILKDKVIYFENKFFDVTNSIASLWFAKEHLSGEEDLLLMNGDVFVEEKLIDKIISTKKSPVLFSDESRIEEADYKLNYSDGILMKYGKELNAEETTGEYIGIAKISKKDQLLIKNSLENMIDNQEHNLWWENSIYHLSNEKEIYVEDVEQKFWAEIDYIEDYIRIKDFVEQTKKSGD